MLMFGVVQVLSCDVDVWCCASLETLIKNPDSYEFRPLAFRSSLPSQSPRFFSASASGAGGAIMPCRDDLVLRVCESVFKPGVCVPAYSWDASAVGGKWWHDHRYLASQAGVTWIYQFKKQESARGILQRVRRDNDLEHFDFQKNESSARHLPLLMSSAAVVGWLGERYTMAVHASGRAEPGYVASWQAMLTGVQDSACKAIQSGVLTGRPEIHCLDLTLYVEAHGMISVEPLLACLPSLPADWTTLSDRAVHGLPPFSGEVQVIALFRFLMLRTKYSNIPSDHPLALLRRGLVRVVAFLLEVAVELGVQETAEKYGDRPPPLLGLFGPSQRTKSHHTPLAKMVAIKSCSTTHGSNETVMGAQGMHKGSSSQLRNAKLALYTDKMREMFKDSTCVWLSHDGSCHGGPSVSVCAAVDPVLEIGAYTKPEARYGDCKVTVESMISVALLSGCVT